MKQIMLTGLVGIMAVLSILAVEGMVRQDSEHFIRTQKVESMVKIPLVSLTRPRPERYEVITYTELADQVEVETIQKMPSGQESIEVSAPVVEEDTRVFLGEFVVTAYCPCQVCCGQWSNMENPSTASGAPAVEGITVGADWETIAVGAVIEIDGVGERTVQDKPAGWIVEKYDGKILDLYFATHEDAWNFGKRTLKVWRVQ